MSELTAKEQKGIGMIEMFCILPVVMVAQRYTFVKTLPLIWVNSVVCKLFLNKAV